MKQKQDEHLRWAKQYVKMNPTEVNIICSGCFLVMSYKVKCKLEYVCAFKELWSSSELSVYPFPYIHDVTSNYSVNPNYRDEVRVWHPRDVCVPFFKAQEHKERWIFTYFAPGFDLAIYKGFFKWSL